MSVIETIVNYDIGSDVNWTYGYRVWDSSASTCGYRNIPGNSADDSANYLLGTANDSTNLGIITKVEFGIKCIAGSWSSGSNGTFAKMTPVFSGTTDGSTYTSDKISYKVNTFWVDITSDGQAPSEWEQSDIDNLDF